MPILSSRSRLLASARVTCGGRLRRGLGKRSVIASLRARTTIEGRPAGLSAEVESFRCRR